MYRKISVKIMYTLWALNRVKKPKLGNVVYYNGEKCCLIQGVNSPRWDLLPLNKENLDLPKRKIYKNIHQNEFKLEPILKRFWSNIKQDYYFQMSNWYLIDIDKKEGISYIN